MEKPRLKGEAFVQKSNSKNCTNKNPIGLALTNRRHLKGRSEETFRQTTVQNTPLLCYHFNKGMTPDSPFSFIPKDSLSQLTDQPTKFGPLEFDFVSPE